MEGSGSLIALLFTVTAISLTGVMAPGPVTAVTVTKGMARKEAGALIAVGHGIVEVPVILLIGFGFAAFMGVPVVKAVIGILGGVVLVWMGVGILRTRPQAFEERREVARGCILAGLTTTVANPYWFVWWATIGAALVASAGTWGVVGLAAFAMTHWLCDLGWLSFLSWGVFTSRRLWTSVIYRGILVASGAVLLGFGAYFLATGVGQVWAL